MSRRLAHAATLAVLCVAANTASAVQPFARAGLDAPRALVRHSAPGSPADDELAQIFAARLAELLAHRHGYDDDAH